MACGVAKLTPDPVSWFKRRAMTASYSADSRRFGRWWLLLLSSGLAAGLLFSLVGMLALTAAPSKTAKPLGTLEWEEKSEFSHIRIRRNGDLRFMCFVRDSGVEVCETEMNLKKQHELILPYAHAMFGSYLLRP